MRQKALVQHDHPILIPLDRPHRHFRIPILKRIEYISLKKEASRAHGGSASLTRLLFRPLPHQTGHGVLYPTSNPGAHTHLGCDRVPPVCRSKRPLDGVLDAHRPVRGDLGFTLSFVAPDEQEPKAERLIESLRAAKKPSPKKIRKRVLSAIRLGRRRRLRHNRPCG